MRKRGAADVLLFGIFILLIALGLFGVLFFPLRLRVRYQLDDGDHQLAVALRLRYATHHPGWEISLFNYSSHQQPGDEAAPKDESSRHPKDRMMAETKPEEAHSGRTPLHKILKSVNIFQNVLGGGDPTDQRKGDSSLLGTILHRRDTPLRFLEYVRDCEAWSWETRLGTGDPASTAIFIGVLWSVKATAYSMLSHWVNFRETPHFSVVPDYNRAHLAVALDGIFRFRLGQIILMETLVMLRKWKKGVGRVGAKQRASY